MQMLIAGNRPRNKQAGFSYVMVLVAMVAVGIVAETASIYESRASQMDREAELLFRGMAYRNAIKSYYEAGRPKKTYPRTLEELLNDPRAAHKAHIRRLYADPMTKAKWRLIPAVDGGIAGVASTSTETPVKTGNFRKELEKFENARSYAEWTFEYVPLAAPGVQLQQAAASARLP